MVNLSSVARSNSISATFAPPVLSNCKCWPVVESQTYVPLAASSTANTSAFRSIALGSLKTFDFDMFTLTAPPSYLRAMFALIASSSLPNSISCKSEKESGLARKYVFIFYTTHNAYRVGHIRCACGRPSTSETVAGNWVVVARQELAFERQ